MAVLWLFWTWLCACMRRVLGLGLQLAPVPQHVAFIMDGNRRFASVRALEKIAGHRRGYRKLMDVIHWCLDLGVPNISVYAFSIDNFQRSEEEVESLMALVSEGYAELSRENGLAEREGVCVRVVGKQSLAPASVQGAAARMMAATESLRNQRAVLNICFSYTSTEDLVQAVDALQSGVAEGQLRPADVTVDLLDSCLRTAGCPPVDLLIRTSGETRLSDFLTWQARNAQLEFLARMWPEFGWLDFARCVLRYQQAAATCASLLSQDSSSSNTDDSQSSRARSRRASTKSSGADAGQQQQQQQQQQQLEAVQVASFLRHREIAQKEWVQQHQHDH